MNNSTTTRAEMCADLARAMGWTGIRKIASHLCGNPPRESDIAPTCYMEGFGQLWDIPDPFTYAEHSRALVAWLAAQLSPTGDESLMIHRFFLNLLTAVSDRANEGKDLKDYNFAQRVLTPATMLHLLTAPPETISLAAWRAIQEEANYMEGFGQLWDIPDPFTYAEHSRALVAWLAADAKLSERFNTILTKNIARYGFPLTPLEALTAPLETIAEAAWRAIQEQPKWKLSAF